MTPYRFESLTEACRWAVIVRAAERVKDFVGDDDLTLEVVDLGRRSILDADSVVESRHLHELWQMIGRRFELQRRIQAEVDFAASNSSLSRALDAWILATLSLRCVCASNHGAREEGLGLAEDAALSALWSVSSHGDAENGVAVLKAAVQQDIEELHGTQQPPEEFFRRSLWPGGAPSLWQEAAALVRTTVRTYDVGQAPSEAGAGAPKVLDAGIRIAEMRLRHFRAFADVRLVLEDLTFLVGRNGSGKSTLLEAFDFLRDALSDSLVNAVERRGGFRGIEQQLPDASFPAVCVAVVLRVADVPVVYGFCVASRDSGFVVREERLDGPGLDSFHRTEHGFQTTIKDLAPEIDGESLALPIIAGTSRLWTSILLALRRILVYNFSPWMIRAEPLIGSSRWLARDGSNLGDTLKEMQTRTTDIQWINQHLQAITPGLQTVHATASAGRRVLEFVQEAHGAPQQFTAMHMSDGTLRGLGILTALRQEPRPLLLCIDEVEDSFHPMAQAVMIDAIAGSTAQTQVVATSHSPEALSHPEVTGERMRIVQWSEGTSAVFHVNEKTKGLLKPPQSVGRLLSSNALWPDREPMRTPDTFWEL